MKHWVLAAALAFLFVWGGQRVGWAAEEFPVPPPPLSPDLYPCAENCHNYQKTNPTPRKLTEMHTDIHLHHAEQFRWCLDCHDAKNRDKLRLQSGETIDFSESYRLCGQCHGDKYRDWRNGVHGKRVGFWNGKKDYFVCPTCHNPHSPRFKPLRPEPPPMVPGSLTLSSHAQPTTHGQKEEGGEAKSGD